MKKDRRSTFNLIAMLSLLSFIGISILHEQTEFLSAAGVDTEMQRIAETVSINPPEGFQLRGQPRFYGTAENRLEHGTIFDYIDGAGENHIRHGFTAVCHIVFEKVDGSRLILDLYDMAAETNAVEAFEDEAICASGSISFDLGLPHKAKTYNYSPDYMLYFVTQKYLVHLSLDNDEHRLKIETLASEIIKIINKE